MEIVNDERPCTFHWLIRNPFLPFESMDASFYSGFPVVTEWTVTLCPRSRDSEFWNFTFYLRCVHPRDEDRAVRRLDVNIELNERFVAREKKEIYRFYIRNGYTFRFDASARTSYSSKADRLTIQVEMHLLNGIQEGNPIHNNLFILCRLSGDLRRLLSRGDYSDLKLEPNDSSRTLPAHSCILRERWCNFFKKHDPDSRGIIQTGISDLDLTDILIYVYSGRLYEGGHPINYSRINALFQVIDRYKLHHLYTVFFEDDSRQDRYTSKCLSYCSVTFPLERENDVPFENNLYLPPWNINPGNDCEFVFQIRLFVNEGRPVFSYTLQSRATHRWQVQVNLRFVMLPKNYFLPMHLKEYTISPGKTLDSGTCNYISDHPIIKRFFLGTDDSQDGRVVQHAIRLDFKYFPGKKYDNFLIEGRGPFQEIYFKREKCVYEVLGYHIYNLLHDSESMDLTVSCPTGNPASSYENFEFHKAIFTARIPNWRSVIKEVPESDAIPDHVTCILNCEPFSDFRKFIYSGNSFPIQNHFIPEVRRFLELGGLKYMWQYLVHQMNSPQQNL